MKKKLVLSGLAWVDRRHAWVPVFNARQLRRGKSKGQWAIKYRASAHSFRQAVVTEIRPVKS
jgi:hypothetical protein